MTSSQRMQNLWPSAAEWQAQLHEQSLKHGLRHLDLLINATGLAYPLESSVDSLPQAPAIAHLLQGTPEHELANQGPILLRLDWDTDQHQAWLAAFLSAVHRDARVLALHSHWPFSALADHLRNCTQAEWNQGRTSGLLRYWEPRLFLATSEMLSPLQTKWFHAPAIGWQWLDRDGKAAYLAGHPTRVSEAPQPLPTLSLSNEQVALMVAWTSAEIFRQERLIQPHDYGLTQKETLVRHLVHAQLAANRESLHDLDQRDTFICEWLTQHSSISPDAGVPG